MYEIWSLGEKPFQNMTNQQVCLTILCILSDCIINPYKVITIHDFSVFFLLN